MPGKIPVNHIATELNKAVEELSNYCILLSDEEFFNQPDKKWSVAQQVKHLTTSTRITTLAFTFPKFVVRLIGGRPNRPSRSYDALVEKYKLKLSEGGKAGLLFSPGTISAKENKKKKLLKNYSRSTQKMILAVKKKWNDNQTDHYIARHPLLGKITLRELCYFTIYHNWHHLDSIRKLTAK